MQLTRSAMAWRPSQSMWVFLNLRVEGSIPSRLTTLSSALSDGATYLKSGAVTAVRLDRGDEWPRVYDPRDLDEVIRANTTRGPQTTKDCFESLYGQVSAGSSCLGERTERKSKRARTR